MNVSEINERIIHKITNQGTDQYVDLPRFLKQFNYPVSLEVSEYIGRLVYHKGFADALEFLCLMANKFYTRIMNSIAPKPILESFIVKEGDSIKEKTKVLIEAVKKWEAGYVTDSELAEKITDFCKNTYGVRLPMASFFLRMLLPERFGTLDVHCVHALKSLGFEIKDVPTDELLDNKNVYFNQYNGLDYMQYNELLTEIGRQYKIPSKFGVYRYMTPSEVDMALYEYDKRTGIVETHIETSSKTLSREEKVQKILNIIEEIVKGTQKGPPWVRKAGNSLLEKMRRYAERNDLDSMFDYYTRLATGTTGKSVGEWLKRKGLPSIESEFEKVKQIYRDG